MPHDCHEKEVSSSGMCNGSDFSSTRRPLVRRRRRRRRRQVHEGMDELAAIAIGDHYCSQVERRRETRRRRGQRRRQQCHEQPSRNSSSSFTIISTLLVGAVLLVFPSVVVEIAAAESAAADGVVVDPIISSWNGTLNETINPSSRFINYWQRDLVGSGGTIDMSAVSITTIPRDNDNRVFEDSTVRKQNEYMKSWVCVMICCR